MYTTVPPKTGGASSKAEPTRAARRVLAVDYGRRRIGLALSDELRITARPLASVLRVNRSSDFRRLREVCRDNGVAHIIVGHPLHMSGEPGEMAEEAARFAARLKKETGIETELVDERLTSWQAKQTVSETGSARRRNGKAIDDIAAAVLLRDYLSRRDLEHAAPKEKSEP